MKYFSMFSGIGGFEYGIGDKGECVGYSEINKYAIQVYTNHFKHTNYGDATKIDPRQLPDFDLLVGGFPCQSFSIAGKRKGFDDTRGTLFFDIARILKEKRPRHLVLENVKGLLSHDSGKTFQTMLGVLSDLGYRVEWQILNSKHFGVPQNRERIFIIGHLRGECGGEILPIGRNSVEDIGKNKVPTLPRIFQETEKLSDAFRIRDTSGNSATLKGLGGGLGAKTGLYAIPVLTPDRINKRQNGRRFKTDGEPAFTLTGQDLHGVYDGVRIRRLTPIECERLQGFPDDWCEGLSDTQQYKCYGNAVTTNVITAIFNKLECYIINQQQN